MGVSGRVTTGKSPSCDYAAAFGDAVAAGFESDSTLPGAEPLGNVLDSVRATGTGGCPSTGDQFATVVLTYKPESTPVDPVTYATAAHAWLAEGNFPTTVDLCGCTVKFTLTGTASGYAGFTEKGTPKTGKCKGGYSSPKSSPKSAKRTTSVSGSVGAPKTDTATATAAGSVAMLAVVVAMAVIKRRTALAKSRSDDVSPNPATEMSWDDSTWDASI
jgi:hypothetical protein